MSNRNTVIHGCYSEETNFNITQHGYAGYGCYGGYIEVLEIINPPEGFHGIIIHLNSWHSAFGEMKSIWEFTTVAQAMAAFEKCKSLVQKDTRLAEQPGFIRKIECSGKPWFYDRRYRPKPKKAAT